MSSQWNEQTVKKRKSGTSRENRKRQRRPRRVTNAVKDPADPLLLEEALKRFQKYGGGWMKAAKNMELQKKY